MGFELILMMILIVLSSFFSCSETALMALSRLKLHHQVTKGKPKAKLIEDTIQHPNQLIATILVGNNLVNTACTAIATGIAISLWGEKGIWISTVFVTVILLIVGEILPKTYAAVETEKTAYRLIYPIRFFMTLFYPLVKILTSISHFLFSWLGISIRRPRPSFSEEELKTIITVSTITGKLSKEKEELLQSIFQLDTRQAKDILTPLDHTLMIDINESSQKAWELVEKHPFSRIPVYDGKRDNIVGVLYIKDFLRAYSHNINMDLRSLIKEALFISETKTVRNLVRYFQKNRTHMAIVINENKEIKGLVTLEDALEEIVGEIEDESDL